MPAMNMFMRKAATEGVEDLKGALFGVIEQMRGASTEAEALSIATEAFGAEGAQRMTTAVRNGAFAFEDLEAAMAGSSGAIMENAEATRTNTERFKMLREEVGERVAGAFAALPAPLQLASAGFAGILASAGPLLVALPTIVSGIKAMNIAHKAGIVITKAAAVAQWLLNAALTANPIGIIVVAIGAVIAAGVLLYKHWDKVRRFAEFVWQKIGGQVEWVVNNVIIRALNMMTFVGRQAIAGLIDMAKTMLDLAPGANKWGDAMAAAASKIRDGIPTIDIHTQKTGEMSEAMDESAMSAEEAARLIGGDSEGQYTGSIKKADEATEGLIRTAGKLSVTMRDQYAAVNSATLEYAGFKRELAATAERARELAMGQLGSSEDYAGTFVCRHRPSECRASLDRGGKRTKPSSERWHFQYASYRDSQEQCYVRIEVIGFRSDGGGLRAPRQRERHTVGSPSPCRGCAGPCSSRKAGPHKSRLGGFRPSFPMAR